MLRGFKIMAAVLAMLLIASVPLLAQMEAGSDSAPGEVGFPQYDNTSLSGTCEIPPGSMASPENPYAPNASDPFDHVPGEFIASYYGSEDMQLLSFGDIASIQDPCERFAAEEAKRQELLAEPGVRYVTYNSFRSLP